MACEFSNFIIRMNPEFFDMVKQDAANQGVDASKWAREAFAEKLASGKDADPRLDSIVRTYLNLNEQGRNHLALCARNARANKELKGKKC